MTSAPSPAAPVGNVYDKAATKNSLERRFVDGFERALTASLPARATSILDVGCGEGRHTAGLAAAFPEATITGIDLADTEWLAAHRNDHAALVAGDAASLPFAADRFDLVVALEVLEHVDAPARVLAEIARVGCGAAILSVPWEPVWRIGNMARGRYLGQLGNTPGHLQHFSRRKFVALVEGHLTVDAVLHPTPWTLVRARAGAGS